jgi:tRNA1Val (adenine37-N6)-methyltransferase
MVKDFSADNSQTGDIQADTLFDGQLICRQKRLGYRFSIDAVLLAHYPGIRKNEKILDLGTGCGVIGLITCYRHQDRGIEITGLENQPDLVALARSNSVENGFDQIFTILEGDIAAIRSLIKPESHTLVISNPPFYAAGTGRLSLNPEAMAARHQGGDGLAMFVEAAAFSVCNRGRVVFIYPAERFVEIINSFSSRRLSPKSVQFIYSYPESLKASLVIIEAVKNGGTGTKVRPPCYVYEKRGGDYSPALHSMFLSC